MRRKEPHVGPRIQAHMIDTIHKNQGKSSSIACKSSRGTKETHHAAARHSKRGPRQRPNRNIIGRSFLAALAPLRSGSHVQSAPACGTGKAALIATAPRSIRLGRMTFKYAPASNKPPKVIRHTTWMFLVCFVSSCKCRNACVMPSGRNLEHREACWPCQGAANNSGAIRNAKKLMEVFLTGRD